MDYHDKIKICVICKGKLELIRKIGKADIYECINCRIVTISNHEHKKVLENKLDQMYNFNNYSIESKKIMNRSRRLISIIQKYKNKGKVIDIGGGFGLFSSVLNNTSNYEVEILEPYLETKYAKDIKVYKKSFEEFIKTHIYKYNVVVALDVIEHFKKPIINLRKTADLMSEDAILVIQVPNYQSLMAKICKKWSWWMVEDHKFMFSPKSIRLILNKTGFKIRFFSTYEDLYDFKKNMDGNFENIRIDIVRKLFKGTFFGFFIPIYILIRKILWRLGFGGLIFLIAQREIYY